ncbi:hypothetical protein G6F56_012189 [Rhizopus delemar]|nr:hypothetical protein G6F56_012189 [Rhizopus delemar]
MDNYEETAAPVSPSLSAVTCSSFGSYIYSIELPFSSELEDKKEEDNVVLADTMEEYVKIVYEDKGQEAAYEAIYNFLKAMERKEEMNYCVNNMSVDRATYARHLMIEVLGDNVNEDFPVQEEDTNMLETFNLTNEKEPMGELEGFNEESWNKLIAQLNWTKEEEITQFEMLLVQNYQQYKSLLEANAQNLLDRNNISYQLAQNVAS